MLSKVIKSGKTARTMTLKGAFPGMLSNMSGQMLAAGETQVARREIGTEEALSFLLF
jgi:hypothetical protein